MHCKHASLTYPEDLFHSETIIFSRRVQHLTTIWNLYRHPGQRSRVRKLQYIAELERTVNTYEVLCCYYCYINETFIEGFIY